MSDAAVRFSEQPDPETSFSEDEGEEAEDDLTEEQARQLYAPLFPVIEQNLRRAIEKLQVELSEKREESKKLKRSREDIGVKLYGDQQQLAKIQMMLERSHEDYNTIHKLRVQSEEISQSGNRQLTVEQEGLAELSGKLSKHKLELDKLNQTVQGVQTYKQQMHDEILVTRRATYKAESNVTELEKEKQRQDYAIDELTTQLKELHEQVALHDAQLLAQQQETRTARDTLREANIEMEKLQFETKQLLQQWQSSLIGMQRRDEALKATEEALLKQAEEMMVLDSEAQGIKAQIKSEQEVNEKHTATHGRINSEVEYLQRCLQMNQERREKLNEQYSMLQKSLEHTDEQMTKVNQEHKGLQDEINMVNKQLQKLAGETQKIEEHVSRQLSDQTTLQKCSQATQEGAEKIRKQIHEKEMEVTTLQNELARIRIDTLNTAAHNEQLKSQLESVLAMLKEREKLVDKYEVEIRRRNDELEKKQAFVDSLNRKFDALTSHISDENNGPLEATIHNLTKSIAEKDRECQDMQHTWVKRQTELVSAATDSSAESEKIQDLSAQYTVQSQRRLRLESKNTQETSELKEIENDIRHAHTDMGRLNDLIARNLKLKQELNEASLNMEKDFQRKLKELEMGADKIEQEVVGVQGEKDAILQDILETERQIMMWERKIQLTKEMQDALDPEVGQSETAAMKKEIQRMSLRYTQLEKRQRELMTEMEKSIHRREAISQGGKVKASRAKGETLATLRRAIDQLRSDIQRITSEAQTCEDEHKQFEFESQKVSSEIDELQKIVEAAREKEIVMQHNVLGDLIRKAMVSEDVKRYSRLSNKMKEAEEGRYKVVSRDETACDRELASLAQKVNAVKRVVQQLAADFPEVQDPLLRVIEFVDAHDE